MSSSSDGASPVLGANVGHVLLDDPLERLHLG